MPTHRPSLRSLAKELDLSHTTVSDALRGAGRVDSATIRRVREAAERAGYRHNPLAATLMSEMRQSRGGTFRGMLAAVGRYEPEQPPLGLNFHRALVAGASARAEELGFKLEEFTVGQAGVTIPRLDSILQSRNVHGLVFLPQWNMPDWSTFEWRHYAGIYADYGIERPALHCICCDHYRSIVAVLARLESMGYRRPGLVLQRQQDERIQHRFSSGFAGFMMSRPNAAAIPPLVSSELDRGAFLTWFEQHRPDVVLAHYSHVIDWMEESGARVPATHGYFGLNRIYQTRPCACLDQQPHGLGARSVELVIGQLQRNERGIPEAPTSTMIPGRWIDGPTLRTLRPGREVNTLAKSA